MDKQTIGLSEIQGSRVALGLMRLAGKTHEEAKLIIKTALDHGINFFDHADIYGDGKSEEVFAKAMKALNIDRKSYVLQSKCGIIKSPSAFNFSKEHIISSVEGILKRLDTDYIDILLLHRPDILWDPKEINEAFHILHDAGKVTYFGVSNMHQQQMSYLQSVLDFPIVANQLQFSITNAALLTTGTLVNMLTEGQGASSIGILDYMREHNITMQAWSPFQYGFFEGVFLDHPKFPELNQKLEDIGKKYGVSKIAITVAWINTHPAKIQTVVGTMTPKRIIECAQGGYITLTREEWYEIYHAAGYRLP